MALRKQDRCFDESCLGLLYLSISQHGDSQCLHALFLHELVSLENKYGSILCARGSVESAFIVALNSNFSR